MTIVTRSHALRVWLLLSACLCTCLALGACPYSVDRSERPHEAGDLRLSLSPAERAYLASLPPLRIGVHPQWAPMAFIDSNGQIGGISADYLDFLRDTLHVRFRLVPTRSWAETVQLANEGRVDIVAAASPFDGLAPGFGLSVPYVRYPLVIVTRDTAPFIGGIEDLDGAQITVMGDMQSVSARFTGLRSAHLVTVGSAEDGLKAVAQGRAFAYIGNLGVVDRIVRERYAGALRVAAPADRIQDLSFGVAPRFAPLLPLIDRVLSAIPESQREHIQNGWLSTRFTFGVAPRTLWLVLAPVGSLTFVFLAILWFNLVRLRKEVRDRQQTAQRELELKRRLIELTQELPSVVFQLSLAWQPRPRFELVFANRRADELMGAGRAAIPDGLASFVQTLDIAQRQRLTRLFLRSARSLERVSTEFEFARGHAGVAWFHVEAAPRMSEGGSVQWSGYLHDVTQAKEAHAALISAKHDAEGAAKARDAFIATVSHEIRTPMSGIVGILQLLDHDGLQDDDRHLVGLAGNAAQLLLRILNDILDFAKSENGGLSLESAPMSVAEIVNRSAGLVAPEIERKGLRLTVSVAQGIAPRHIGDGQRLGQVLLNLLGNAAKFTERGTVSISADLASETAAQQTLHIRVTDTGIGISRDDQARLFSPFSQASDTRASRGGGTGLGLAISKRLIEQMGGEIALESELGRGTTITLTLTLPIDRSPWSGALAERAALEKLAPPSSAPEPPRILLVDDQAVNREVLRRQLARLNVTCDIAEDGRRALNAVAQGDYTMVITDCVMPVLDGVALIANIRRSERDSGRHTVLVALTADATPARRKACFDAGADEVFVKPLTPDPLRTLLARYGQLGAPSAGFDDGRIGSTLWPQLTETLRADMSALLACSSDRDRQQARDLVHAIAGTAAWFQLREVAEMAGRLQVDLDADGAWPRCAVLALQSEVERAVTREAL